MQLKPPPDFRPHWPRRDDPTLDELLACWDREQARVRDREVREEWQRVREHARGGSLADMEDAGVVPPSWLGPKARRALPSVAPGRPLRAAGVDTWSVCWRLPEGSEADRAVRALAPREGYRAQVLRETAAEHRVMWFADAQLLAAEGHPQTDGLAPPGELVEVHERLQAAVGQLIGAELSEQWDGGVRRLDATADVPSGSAGEGLALLAGVAAVQIGGVQTVIRRAVGGGRVETVELHGHRGRRILGRVYDKGVEAGVARPGVLVRLEDQRRYDAGARRSVEELTVEYVRNTWRRRFLPLWRATKGVKVAGPLVLAERIGELIDTGELTPGQARAVAGFLLLEAAGVQQGSRRTRYRLRATAAEAGLVLADGLMQEIEVDLGAIVEDVLESDAWTAKKCIG